MVCLLAEALAIRGFQVHLISWDRLDAVSFYTLPGNVKWHRLDFSPGSVDKMRRLASVYGVLRTYCIRVLIGFVMSGDRTIFGAAKLAGTKIIAAERNAPAIYRTRYNQMQRWLSLTCLHFADRITVQFPDYVREYPPTLHNRIEVIPNPVWIPTIKACAQRPGHGGRCTVLAVGRLDKVQKQFHKLIEAFALIAKAHPAWDLRIIGNGPEEASLRQLTIEYGMSDRIRIESSIRNIGTAYEEANLFAMPSRWEGFPNALAEALAHGLPAVGFREAPGVSQLIKDGETGWLADGVDDERALAAVLDEALSDGLERDRRAANGIQSMAAYAPEQQFDSWSRLVLSVTE